jgi:Cu2+-exporting ATPase
MGTRWEDVDSSELPASLKRPLALLAAMERFSEHPVAAAVRDLASRSGIQFEGLAVRQLEVRPGLGIRAEVEGHRLVAGTREWLRSQGVAQDPKLLQASADGESLGRGVLSCAIDGQEALLLGLEDRLRDESVAVVQRLRREGIRVTLLTGDRRRSAEGVAARLGGVEFIAEVLPEEKDRVVAQLQKDDHRVAMVGDGINDAPALVRSDVGIAMGSGTDVSIASADIVLMRSELHKVHLASALSRRTLRTVRQNIGISIVYNFIMVPMAMAAVVTPLVAAVSMPMSSLAVIGNSARIRTLFRDEVKTVERR